MSSLHHLLCSAIVQLKAGTLLIRRLNSGVLPQRVNVVRNLCCERLLLGNLVNVVTSILQRKCGLRMSAGRRCVELSDCTSASMGISKSSHAWMSTFICCKSLSSCHAVSDEYQSASAQTKLLPVMAVATPYPNRVLHDDGNLLFSVIIFEACSVQNLHLLENSTLAGLAGACNKACRSAKTETLAAVLSLTHPGAAA